jgi:hypothetical protein
VSWDRSARIALTSCDDFQVPGRLLGLPRAMLRRVATKKRGRAAAPVAPTLLGHLVEEPKRPGRPSGDAAAASNKRPLGENPAARKLSRVMVSVNRRLALNSLCLFSAACAMRVTFAGQFRIVGKMWRAMSLEIDLRREVVWHSDAVAASLRQVGQM